MQQHPLTVIVNIKPDQKGRLKELLYAIRTDINKNPYLRFPEITTTHFARFVLIGGGTRATRDLETRLYFSVNFDGEWEDYIDLLIDKAGTAVEGIFSACEGYPNLKLSDPNFKKRFKDFIKANTIKTNTFYQGYREKTVQEVQQSIARRAQLEDLVNLKGIEGLKAEVKITSGSNSSILGKVGGFLKKAGGKVLGFILSPVSGWLKKNVNNVLNFLLSKIIGVRVFPEVLPEPSVPSPEVDTRDEFTDYLESVQNEMTIVSEIDPKQLGATRRILWLVNLLSKFVFNKGVLGGISTIHFARWVIIDNGKNLLFESNYDGNWEQYIGDFVDKAALGMDSIWGNSAVSVDYPKYGSKDLQAFKKVIINHQVPAAVFYTAYRFDSVRNILNDLVVSRLSSAGATEADFNELCSHL